MTDLADQPVRRTPIRFTVRRMMLAIAIFALILVFGRPIGRSLTWLYHAPKSINLFECKLDPWADWMRKPVSINETIRFHYPYACEIGSSIPPWLPYQARVDVKIIDGSTGNFINGIVMKSAHSRHILMNGLGSWGKADGQLEFEMTPAHPGHYVVRYEAHVTDLFGRSGMSASHTAGFQAQ